MQKKERKKDHCLATRFSKFNFFFIFMTIYPGTRSLDAEIHIDFDKKEINMDYNLNKLGSPYNSNESVILKNEFDNLTKKEKIIKIIKVFFIWYFTIFYYAFIVPEITFLTERNFIKNKNYQIEHQRILKYCQSITSGIHVRKFEGPFKNNKLECKIPRNIWFSYTMEKDFEKEIKSISLLRNFETTKIFGIYEKIAQCGWKIIFEFKNPPQEGSLILEYV